MKDAGISDNETILCPQYRLNKEINLYEEIDLPP